MDKKNFFLTKSIPVNVKDIDDKKGIVSGYFASFGTIDSDNDMIVPGAFKKTIAENGTESAHPRIKHLRNHDATKVIGVLQELKEDNFGLYFVSKLGRSREGKDALLDYEDGIITEHSIGFNIIQENNDSDYRKLTELRLWEGSAVTWGANSNTPVMGVKDIAKLSKNEMIEIMDKMCKRLRNGQHSDEYLELAEIQLRQVMQYISTLDSKESQEGTRTIEPEISAEDLFSIFNKQFKK